MIHKDDYVISFTIAGMLMLFSVMVGFPVLKILTVGLVSFVGIFLLCAFIGFLKP